MDNEHLMDYRVGLIHSHHNMNAFFSSTDTTELHEKAIDGLYLSLIVNNDMEPVCKLCWMGQVERKIETYNSWNLGFFVRKPKKVTKTEIANVFYEIQMEINWHDSIDTIADRYNELEDEEQIVRQGKHIHSTLTEREEGQYRFGYGIGETKGERDANALAGRRWEEPRPATGAAAIDGPALFIENLERKGILEQCFAAIITQNPKTQLTLTQALNMVMQDIRTDVEVLRENNGPPSQEDYMELYTKTAKEHAEMVIIGGDDIITEKLDEFYIDDDDYYALLAKLYDSLAKSDDTILCQHLKTAISAIALNDEEEDDDKKDVEDITEDENPVIMGGL